MDTIFIVPTLVSPSVPENMIPAIAKLVERNILTNYYGVIRRAVQIHITREKLTESSSSYMKWKKDKVDYEFDIKAQERLIQAEKDKNMSSVGNKSKNMQRLKMKMQQSTLDNLTTRRDANNANISAYEEKRNAEQKNKRDDEVSATSDKRSRQKDDLNYKRDQKDKPKERKSGVVISDKGADYKINTIDVEKNTETVKGIEMYATISLEPTVAVFPINIKRKDNAEIERTFKVGIKCVPYTITNEMADLVTYMTKVSNSKWAYNFINRYVIKKFNKLKKRIILSRAWRTKTGRNTPGESPTKDVLYSLDVDDIRNATKLSKKFKGPSSNIMWTSLLVLDMSDFDSNDNKAETEKIFTSYRKLASIGWGDMVILNSESEIINFCSLSLLHCVKYPLSYLKKILNVRDIIDFSEINRSSKMFSMSPYRSAVKKLFVRKKR